MTINCKERTRNNKMRLVETFTKIRNTADYMLKEYICSIPEEESKAHSDLVEKFTNDFVAIEKLIAETFNHDVYEEPFSDRTKIFLEKILKNS